MEVLGGVLEAVVVKGGGYRAGVGSEQEGFPGTAALTCLLRKSSSDLNRIAGTA